MTGSSIERVQAVRSLKGSVQVPGDKSISHRSLMFGAMAKGQTRVHGLLESADVLSTKGCLQALGVEILKQNGEYVVQGVGPRGFQKPKTELDCGNSGTTMRLLMGLVAAQPFDVTMIGDESLSGRPMNRVAAPLRLMGAQIELNNGNFAPVIVKGRKLKGISYALPVASAQIKSALLIAGVLADGETRLTGEIHSRDHTERMFPLFGVQMSADKDHIRVRGGQDFKSYDVTVPGDPSTAAFWMAAAAITEDSEIELKNISLNPTRTGFIRVLERMGARIETKILRQESEPIGNVTVRSSKLKGTEIKAEEVPELIDEIPLIAILGLFASGETIVSGAEELRVKESDRIESVVKNISAMGGTIKSKPDGFVVRGPQKIRGASIETFHDHRIAMAFSIAGLRAEGLTEIQNAECAGVSYPEFFKTLKKLMV